MNRLALVSLLLCLLSSRIIDATIIYQGAYFLIYCAEKYLLGLPSSFDYRDFPYQIFFYFSLEKLYPIGLEISHVLPLPVYSFCRVLLVNVVQVYVGQSVSCLETVFILWALEYGLFTGQIWAELGCWLGLAVVFLNFFVFQIFNRPTKSLGYELFIYFCYGVSVVTVVSAVFFFQSPTHAFYPSYLVSIVNWPILGYWLIMATVGAGILAAILRTDLDSDSVVLNYRRKVWHYFVFLVIVPTLRSQEHLQFVKVALCHVVVAFIVVESIRLNARGPLAQTLHSTLISFADQRDRRGYIISYIYLIAGVSYPIFINGSCLGLIGLGIGDSFASVVGKKVGGVKWWESQKTVAGTVAFVGSCVAVIFGLKYGLGYEEFVGVRDSSLVMICVVGGLMEALSGINDNLWIPIVMMITGELSARGEA